MFMCTLWTCEVKLTKKYYICELNLIVRRKKNRIKPNSLLLNCFIHLNRSYNLHHLDMFELMFPANSCLKWKSASD